MKLIHSEKAMDRISVFDFGNGSSNEYNIKQIRRVLPRVIDEKLTLRQRQCVQMYYFKKLNMQEIGEVLGIDRTTVSRNLSRARKRIKTSLEYLL